MGEEKLEEFLQTQLRYVEAICQAKTDGLMPAVIIEGTDGDGENSAIYAAIADLPETADGRRAMVEMIAANVAKELPEFTPERIGITTEAWMRAFDEKSEEHKTFLELGLQVSQLDDKIEVVIIAAMDKDGNTGTITIPILRDEDNNIILDTENTSEVLKMDAFILQGFFPSWMVERL